MLTAVVALPSIWWVGGSAAGATRAVEAWTAPAELSRKVTSAPRALKATPRPQQVVLSWSAPSTGKPTGYRVQRRAAGATAWTTVVDRTKKRTLTVTKLTNGTTYSFRVFALHRSGVSRPSAVVTATPGRPPSAPRDVRATTGNRSVILTWTAPTTGPITGYVVERRTGSTWRTVGRPVTARTVTLDGLTNGVAHTHRVRALNRTGQGAPSAAVTATPPTTLDIAAGAITSCAVAPDRTARCWGYNANGEVGDATTTNRLQPTTVAVDGTSPLTGVAGIVSNGGGGTCAWLTDGTARCWGRNEMGRLGDGTTTPRTFPVTVEATAGTPLTGVSRIEGGSGHRCALLTDRTMRCWGDNPFGQLGDGTTGTPRLRPVAVEAFENNTRFPLTGVTSIALGVLHTCASTDTGRAWCWGIGTDGVLGTGTATGKNFATAVTTDGTTPLTGVAQVAVGSVHSCARLTDGTVRCWGRNLSGQLGDGSTTTRFAPVAVTLDGTTPLTGVVHLSAGSNHTCALLADRTARCWGDNANGRLGDGTTMNRTTAVRVTTDGSAPLTGIVTLSAGGSHTCARLAEGTTRCWGDNQFGQLGDGTVTSSSTPVRPTGL